MWVWQSTFEMLSMPIVHRFRNCVIWGAGCLCSPTFQFACQGFRAALMASPRIPLRSLPVIQAKAGVLPKRSSSSTRCALCIETGTKRLGTRGNGWIGSLAENENWEKTLYKNDVTFKSTNPNDSSNQYDLFSRSGLGALQFWIRRINASLDPFLPMWPYHSRILYSKWFCRLELQKVSPKFMESSDRSMRFQPMIPGWQENLSGWAPVEWPWPMPWLWKDILSRRHRWVHGGLLVNVGHLGVFEKGEAWREARKITWWNVVIFRSGYVEKWFFLFFWRYGTNTLVKSETGHRWLDDSLILLLSSYANHFENWPVKQLSQRCGGSLAIQICCEDASSALRCYEEMKAKGGKGAGI